MNSARRTLNHPPKHRLRAELISQVEASPLLPYARGHGCKISIDATAVKIVVTKIVRGLHWYVTAETLPSIVDLQLFQIKQGESLSGELQIIFEKFGKSIQKCGEQFEAI